MKAFVFPGQGAQFPGMGKDLYDHSDALKARFELANEILGFVIADTMFNGSPEDLKQTSVTQPAIFIHSVVLAEALGDAFQPDVVAGHSLGEFSALVAAGALSAAAVAIAIVPSPPIAPRRRRSTHRRNGIGGGGGLQRVSSIVAPELDILGVDQRLESTSNLIDTPPEATNTMHD